MHGFEARRNSNPTTCPFPRYRRKMVAALVLALVDALVAEWASALVVASVVSQCPDTIHKMLGSILA
jgi:hypothetical protein